MTTALTYEQCVALVYAPKGGVEEPDWRQHRDHLVAQALMVRLQVKYFDLGHMMYDMKYFSGKETDYFYEIVDLIRTDRCRFVWFAGNGVSEAVRALVHAAYLCRKESSYVGLRQAKEVKRFLDWYRLVEETISIPIRRKA